MLTPERKKDQERWSLLMNFLKKKDKTTLKRLNYSKLDDEKNAKNLLLEQRGPSVCAHLSQ